MKTLTLMIPYRNYDLMPFEIALKLMHRQTRAFNEILVSDLSSNEPFASNMEDLCGQYGVKYIHTEIDIPGVDAKTLDKVISVHLWKMNYNIGIRASSGDFILCSGTDRVYEDQLCETVASRYESYTETHKRDVMVCATAWRLKRLPALREFDDFNALWVEGRSKGGFGAMGASKKWWESVRGFDETLRWFADNDMARRAKQSGIGISWVNRKWREGMPLNRIIHPVTHRGSRRRYGGSDVIEISRRGKRAIHRRTGWKQPVRNDETWGKVTEEKLNRALSLVMQARR